MTLNEEHKLIAETKFKPYIEALLQGKQIQFKHCTSSVWKDLNLYTLVVNNLTDYEFRFKPNYEELSNELFKKYNLIICKMSSISYIDALSNHITFADIRFKSDKYIIPLNPYTLNPIQTVEDYHKVPEY